MFTSRGSVGLWVRRREGGRPRLSESTICSAASPSVQLSRVAGVLWLRAPLGRTPSRHRPAPRRGRRHAPDSSTSLSSSSSAAASSHSSASFNFFLTTTPSSTVQTATGARPDGCLRDDRADKLPVGRSRSACRRTCRRRATAPWGGRRSPVGAPVLDRHGTGVDQG